MVATPCLQDDTQALSTAGLVTFVAICCIFWATFYVKSLAKKFTDKKYYIVIIQMIVCIGVVSQYSFANQVVICLTDNCCPMLSLLLMGPPSILRPPSCKQMAHTDLILN